MTVVLIHTEPDVARRQAMLTLLLEAGREPWEAPA
jgi:hypothetical protein